MRYSPSDPGFSHSNSPIHIHVHLSSPTTNSLPVRSPIQLDPSCDRLNNRRLDTKHDSDHALHTNVLKKNARILIIRLCTQSESTSIALELQFITTRGSDHSSKLFLSPRNSYSNELNHTSDAAEDHDHGYKLLATELLNLFLSFGSTLLA
jgi:hypothetical protein